jgi:pimeloyl-ACP methyl ester carboxylesterase
VAQGDQHGDLAAHGVAHEHDLPVAGLGTKVAMLIALRHPELIERLMVVDISPGRSWEGGGEFPHLLGSLQLEVRLPPPGAVRVAQILQQEEAHRVLGDGLSQLGIGSESDYVSEAQLPLMSQLFPRVELRTVQGAGHWVWASLT